MSLLDTIESHVTPDMLQRIGGRVGLSPEQVQAAMAGLAPVLEQGVQQHGATGALPPPPGEAAPGGDAAAAHGSDVLATIFGSVEAGHAAAAPVAAQTGLGMDQLRAVLPQLASVAASAFLARRGQA